MDRLRAALLLSGFARLQYSTLTDVVKRIRNAFADGARVAAPPLAERALGPGYVIRCICLALAHDTTSAAGAYVDELITLAASMIRHGICEGAFRGVNALATARAILAATSCFHHSAHAAEWAEASITANYNDIWKPLLAWT